MKISERRGEIEEMMKGLDSSDLDVKLNLIQMLIPLGLQAVNDALQKEVREWVGKRYAHGKENTSWGKQNGSVYLSDQKAPLKVPRIRNKITGREVPLQTYQKLQRPYKEDGQIFKKLLNGLSMRKYQESTEIVPQVFGISPSNVSRRFKKITSAKLRQLQTRRLNKHDFVAMFIDGKRFAEEGLMIALGITIEGEKVILGIEQMSTENHRAIGQFFNKLVERGFNFEEGVLCIVDGAKGLRKAIRQVFGDCAIIQRCQWHKMENVVGYLNPLQQKIYRRKIKAAHSKTTYNEALSALGKLKVELEGINPSAAGSLREGMEETLTIHRLGLCTELKRSFSTTNCIESIMSQVEQYTERVDYWRDGKHIQRWVGAGLLEVEPRLNRVHGCRYLKLLRRKLKAEIEKRQKGKNISVPKEQELAQAGV